MKALLSFGGLTSVPSRVSEGTLVQASLSLKTDPRPTPSRLGKGEGWGEVLDFGCLVTPEVSPIRGTFHVITVFFCLFFKLSMI